MQNIKEKVSNAAAAGKEHVDIMKAKAEEKAAKATARTKEEKVIAEETRKAKESEAKMKLHETKAQNAAEKLRAKQSHGCLGHVHHHLNDTVVPVVGVGQADHQPLGGVAPVTEPVTPTYPLEGHTHGTGYHYK